MEPNPYEAPREASKWPAMPQGRLAASGLFAIATIFALIGGYLLYLTCFNWWAAGGPPTPNPEVYAARGDTFFALALASFVVAVVALLRSWRAK
jgi:hypothetical protein